MTRRSVAGGTETLRTLLTALVALVLIAVLLVIALSATGGLDQNSTPLVVTVLGFVGLAVPSLLALLKSAVTLQRTEELASDLRDGLIPEKLAEAVENGVVKGTLHVQPDRRGMRTRASDRTDIASDDNAPNDNAPNDEGGKR